MSKWYRVNKKRPCRACSRKDWCTYTADGATCCMRVQSDIPMRNGGWLHRDENAPRYIQPIRKAIPGRPIDAAGIWEGWAKATDYQKLDRLGESLGVDTDALKAIGCAWASPHNAWAFPMKAANGKVIGIRLRNEAGSKWAVKGSRSGLFIPSECPFDFDGTLWLTEGPTDLAAALTLGLFAIGRPACLGQEFMVLSYIRLLDVRRLVIVTDNDEPGIRGAERLQSQLPILSCIWVPPVKDIREFLLRGGNRRMIESSVKDRIWTQPRSVAA